MGKRRFRLLSWRLGVSLVLVMVLVRCGASGLGTVIANWGRLELGQALTQVEIDEATRLLLLQRAQQHLGEAQRWPEGSSSAVARAISIASAEERWLRQARVILDQTMPSNTMRIGRQLITNPDFTLGLSGWGQYQATWDAVPDPEQPSNVVATNTSVVSGLGGLYQIVSTLRGRCYLLIADVRFQGDQPLDTQILYWESYTNGVPFGQVFYKHRSPTHWVTYSGSFCAPADPDTSQFVAIYPARISAETVIWIDNVRLYELSPSVVGSWQR
jgi:hypothetical protein